MSDLKHCGRCDGSGADRCGNYGRMPARALQDLSRAAQEASTGLQETRCTLPARKEAREGGEPGKGG